MQPIQIDGVDHVHLGRLGSLAIIAQAATGAPFTIRDEHGVSRLPTGDQIAALRAEGRMTVRVPGPRRRRG